MGRSARHLPRTRPRSSLPRICGGPSGSMRSWAALRLDSTWPRSCGGWGRSGWATPGCGCWCHRRGCATCARSGRGSTPGSACTAARTGRSASPSAAPASASARRTWSTPRCGSRSTAGTARSSPRWCCASSTRAPPTRTRSRPSAGGSASRPSWLVTQAIGRRRRPVRRPTSAVRCAAPTRPPPWSGSSLPAVRASSPSAPTPSCGRGWPARERDWPTTSRWKLTRAWPPASTTSSSSTRRRSSTCSASPAGRTPRAAICTWPGARPSGASRSPPSPSSSPTVPP